MIRMNDFTKEPEDLQRQQLVAVDRVLRSGRYVLGPEVRAFEKQFALTCNARHAIGVANGMDAIEIALRALGIGPGDEVITTTMTAFATVLAILRAGATPRLADIDLDTGLMSMESARRCLNSSTRAIVLVHLYGQLAHLDDWVKFCGVHDLLFIEDCAQAHLAAWGNGVAGTFGKCGAYSFYPTKNLGAIGDAGLLLTQDDAIADVSRCLRNYGQSERYCHPLLGLNSRLDELQAAILLERLKWLAEFTNSRRAHASTYREQIRNSNVRLLAAPQRAESHVYHLFVICCGRRDELSLYLKAHGVESFAHYPIPIHRQPSCANLPTDPSGLSYAEEHARTCLSIPCHHNMDECQVAKVIESINSFQ